MENLQDYKIVVIESGFVYLCEISKEDHPVLGKCVKGRNAWNIRRWGTDKGLGQLAAFGKQPNTVLDYTGVVTIPVSKVLHIIDVSKKAQKTFENDK